MFESYTASAERTLIRADRLARRRGAGAIEPLDLLAALAAEPESRAAELLLEFGVEPGRLWAELDPEVLDLLAEFQDADLQADGYSTGPAPRRFHFRAIYDWC